MIFWDLDGPILDVKMKYYKAYKDILSENQNSVLDADTFWKLKRSKTSVEDILHISKADISLELFRSQWIERIEAKSYMDEDRLQPGIQDVLFQCQQKNEMILITLRRSRERLIEQLTELDLSHYFDDVLSSGEQITPRWKIKYRILKNTLKDRMNGDHTIIGDTETDILAGNELGFTTIAVLCGIRDETLLQAKPNYYVNESISLMEHFK